MTWQSALQMMGHGLTAGGIVLAAGWMAMRLSRGAARQALIGTWTIRAALLATTLSFFPSWLLLPKPEWVAQSLPTAPVADASRVAPEREAALPSPQIEATEPEPNTTSGSIWDSAMSLTTSEPPPAITEPTLPAIVPAAETAPTETLSKPDLEPSFDWQALTTWLSATAVVGYLAFACLLLGQLVVGGWVLRQLRRGARPLPPAAEEIVRRMTLTANCHPRVLCSDRIKEPFCFGLWQPTILLPTAMVESVSPRLRWVLAHEIDHVRRGDHQFLFWLGMARALFFVLPWYWLLRRDLLLAQEYLADAAAAAEGESCHDYAEFLIDLSVHTAASRSRSLTLAAAGVRAGKSTLFRRVTMLLKFGSQQERRCSRRWSVFAACGVLSLAAVASGVGFAGAQPPTPAAPAARDKAAIVKDLRRQLDEALKREDDAQVKRLFDEIENILKGGAPSAVAPPPPPAPGSTDPVAPPKPPLPPATPPAPKPDARNPRERDEGVREPRKVLPPDVALAPLAPLQQNLQEQLMRQMEVFDKMLQQFDDPDVRKQIEKSREDFKRAMEESAKQAEALRDRMRVRPGRPDNLFVPLQPGLPPIPANPAIILPGNPGALPGQPMVIDLVAGAPGLPRAIGQGQLGIAVERPSSVIVEQLNLAANEGLVIVDFARNSVAEKAGIKKNDILVQLAGKEVVSDIGRLQQIVSDIKPGEKFDAVVVRKGKKETIKGIELPEAPQPRPNRGGLSQLQIQLNGGTASLQATEDGVQYSIQGQFNEGKLELQSLRIQDGGEVNRYKSLDAVPEKYRGKVEGLIARIERR